MREQRASVIREQGKNGLRFFILHCRKTTDCRRSIEDANGKAVLGFCFFDLKTNRYFYCGLYNKSMKWLQAFTAIAADSLVHIGSSLTRRRWRCKNRYINLTAKPSFLTSNEPIFRALARSRERNQMFGEMSEDIRRAGRV